VHVRIADVCSFARLKIKTFEREPKYSLVGFTQADHVRINQQIERVSDAGRRQGINQTSIVCVRDDGKQQTLLPQFGEYSRDLGVGSTPNV
jgi:hypothetical protein